MANTQFLSLVNKLLRRLNEVEIEQSDFPSVKGVQAMAKDAINASIEEINHVHFEWPFNTTSGTQLLVVGQNQYDFPAALKTVDWNSFHIVKDDTLDTNTIHLKFGSKDQWENYFKDKDQDASTDGVGRPVFIFRGQNYGFGVSPSPDKAYTVEFDYWLNFTPLDLYNDTPTVPSNFDEVIIQGALYHFYMFRDNDSQSAAAEKKFSKLFAKMVNILGNPDDTMQSTLIVRTSPWGMQQVYSGGSGD